MHEKETRFLSTLEKLEKNRLDTMLNIDATIYLGSLKKLPLTDLTPAFLCHPTFIRYVQRNPNDKDLQFWYLLASYFLHNDNTAWQQEQLLKIDLFCSTAIEKYNHENFPLWDPKTLVNSGCQLQPEFLNNPFVIRNIYMSQDQTLISIIQKYAPTPKVHVFAGVTVPEMIAKEQAAAHQSITTLLDTPDQDLKTLEDQAIKIQRSFRKHRRLTEEKHRVEHVYQTFFKASSDNTGHPMSAEKLLREANKPYLPKKCNQKLAARIISLAQQTELYTTIRHLTSSNALKSIFNDAFYGRRSLQQFFIPFKPAALMRCDVENGDGNVICFGPNKIDPKASGDIEIVLDLKTVIDGNPAAFYKESDLAYVDEEIREVKLHDALFLFLPIKPLPDGSDEMMPFRVLGATWGELLYSAQIPKPMLIAYDLKNLNQIFILNFFRFIDELRCPKGEPATDYIAQFYHALEQMSDSELQAFLKEAASKLTQTAEFNFFSAYRLDFSSIITVRTIDRASPVSLKKEFTLDMKLLMASLASGNLDILEMAKKSIPSLFTSYRFLDYLISKTEHAESKRALESLRKTCDVPPWVDNKYYQHLLDEAMDEGIHLSA